HRERHRAEVVFRVGSGVCLKTVRKGAGKVGGDGASIPLQDRGSERDETVLAVVLGALRRGDVANVRNQQTADGAGDNLLVGEKGREASHNLQGRGLLLLFFVKRLDVAGRHGKAAEIIATDHTDDSGIIEPGKVDTRIVSLSEDVVDVAAGSGVRCEIDVP